MAQRVGDADQLIVMVVEQIHVTYPPGMADGLGEIDLALAFDAVEVIVGVVGTQGAAAGEVAGAVHLGHIPLADQAVMRVVIKPLHVAALVGLGAAIASAVVGIALAGALGMFVTLAVVEGKGPEPHLGKVVQVVVDIVGLLLLAGHTFVGGLPGLVAVGVVVPFAGEHAVGIGVLMLLQQVARNVIEAGNLAQRIHAVDRVVGRHRGLVVGLQIRQVGAHAEVLNGVDKLAGGRIAVFELHLPGDIALGVMEVTGPDAAVLVGEGHPAVGVEIAVGAVLGQVAASSGNRSQLLRDRIQVDAGQHPVAHQTALTSLGQGDRLDGQIADNVVEDRGNRSVNDTFLNTQRIVARGELGRIELGPVKRIDGRLIVLVRDLQTQAFTGFKR